jgi:hypothetical protein
MDRPSGVCAPARVTFDQVLESRVDGCVQRDVLAGQEKRVTHNSKVPCLANRVGALRNGDFAASSRSDGVSLNGNVHTFAFTNTREFIVLDVKLICHFSSEFGDIRMPGSG